MRVDSQVNDLAIGFYREGCWIFNNQEEVKVFNLRNGIEHWVVIANSRFHALNQRWSRTNKRELYLERDLGGPRAQRYRVKRLSACGGCLGDYRR